MTRNPTTAERNAVPAATLTFDRNVSRVRPSAGQLSGSRVRAPRINTIRTPDMTPENLTVSITPHNAAIENAPSQVSFCPARQSAYTRPSSDKEKAISFLTRAECARKLGSRAKSAVATTAASGPLIRHAHQPINPPSTTPQTSIIARDRATILSPKFPGVLNIVRAHHHHSKYIFVGWSTQVGE